MNRSMNAPILVCRQLAKVFRDGAQRVTVLKEVNLTLQRGERVAIVGASGEGKSTLLHVLGGLDHPTSGEVLIDNQNMAQLREKKRCILRNRTMGFVYQFHHLLPEFTALENVCMPLLIRNEKPEHAILEARFVLEKVGLGHRLDHKIGELSGGERQRTAIARAIVTRPLCILADEPTGNLDHVTAQQVYETLLVLNQTFQTALLIVTHDMRLANQMDRILRLEAGELREERA